MTLTFTIPGLPPSANARLGAHVTRGKAVLHRNKGATSWQATVGAYGRLAMGRRPLITTRVAVRIVFRVGPMRRRDIDAGIKDSSDALISTILTDDRLIRSLTVDLEDVPREDESTTITVLVLP